MANTRSASRATAAAKVAKKPVGKKAAKQEQQSKTLKNGKQTKKIEKELNEKKESEEAKAEKAEEEDFQLPSDSDDSDAEEKNEDSEESDTELAIHDDIISSGKESVGESKTRVSNQAGHTVIKPVGGSGKSDKTEGSKSKRGVIYIGRLPNGFEEKELRKYFEQFGEITRLRLSRNKKTGKSKHYAFIEFKESEVAKIAAETMDNYLLMGHLLKVSVLNNDKIHEKMFVGANIKFKVVPYGKINQLKHDKKKSKAEWEKLNKNHVSSIKSKQESLAAKGIDYDLTSL